MVKAYLRYEFAGAFGVVTSNANPVYDVSGKLLITSALENIAVYNIKQGTVVQTLAPGPAASTSSGTGAGAVAEVTCIARSPSSASQIAAGYSDGTLRLWDISSGECTVTLKGHKSAVSALRFNASGSLLVSGSKDTDLIMWDVVGESGLYRLRGHKDQVTDVVFVSRGNRLVSCSKDGLVKVWDLDTQHCSQTVTGHKAEVWSLDVNPQETRLVTGSTDLELRVYSIHPAEGEEDADVAGAHADVGAEEAGAPSTSGRESRKFLRPMGSVRRAANDRVVCVRYDPEGGLLACQGAGKSVEVFRVRSEDEAARKLKRRKKRRREKAQKKASAKGGDADGEGEDGADGAEGEEDEDDTIKASDELEAFQVVACKHKVRAMAFAPHAAFHQARKAAAAGGASPAAGPLGQLALALTNNSVEVVDIGPESSEVVQRLDQGGHRSDIRTVALSPDDNLLLSASNSSLKVWNPRTGSCLSTMDSGYGLCALFAPGNRHAVLGTKEGGLEIFDLGAAERVHVETAHEGAVWSIAPLPDGSGFVTGSADKTVKFWQWSVAVSQDGAKQLRLSHQRTLKMADDVLCVKVSPDGKLLAVSLLDSTIKVFYANTLKFFLSLYGHKLPVLCMDISSDSTLLVTGSADKNIKVWGLDFGDCHKSLFAHQDAVMSVSFVRNTHYAFTAGKDKAVKYWDLDRFEMLLELAGHHGEVWCLAVSSYGDFVVSGSHDRSLRRWERTNEPFFVEEEREKRLESLFEADLEQQGQREDGVGAAAGEEGAVAPAGRKTLDSVSAADSIIEALDLAAHELDRAKEHEEEVAKAAAAGAKAPPAPLPNPMMLGLSPSAYVLRSVGGVKAADLESALLMLPFTDALRLLSYLPRWLDDGGAASSGVETTTRVAVLLLRLHHSQLVATPAARPVLLQLQARLRRSVQGLKDVMGFNLAALQHVQRAGRERRGVSEQERLAPAKRMLGKA